MPTPLDYATPQPRKASDRPSRAELVVCIVLTLVTLQTFARVEILNARGGYPLPFPSWSTGKWRESRAVDETAFRYFNAQSDPTLMSRPLSPAERESIRQNVFRNRLRGVVGTWGLAQYALVPFGLVISVVVLGQRRRSSGGRALAGVCFVANLLAGASVLHRGYFSSLGM
jgi:hypothetical protein